MIAAGMRERVRAARHFGYGVFIGGIVLAVLALLDAIAGRLAAP